MPELPSDRWTPGSSVNSIDGPLRAALGFAAEDASWFAQLGARLRPKALGRLGPYELLAEAGRGGQGLVYRARQDRPAREVALKRLAAGVFATPTMRARFEREIESAAALDHPNIVAVYGTHEIDGQLIVALQWIDGLPLDRWARPAGAPPRALTETLNVFLKVCDAVQHAHQRGVIHRDLKPSNILVDAAGEPHVLDFGLARRISEASPDPTLTHSGAFVGTPAYASPEQLRGDARRVDARSDVYSLGAVMFHALTGSPPVDGSLPPSELLRQIESREPRWPDRLNPALDRAISSIVVKALQPDPAYRYPSVEALLAELHRYVGGELVLAHPPDVRYRTRMFARRYRWGLAVAAAISGTLIAATAFSTWQYLRAVSAQKMAEAALRNERAAREASDRTSATLKSVNDFQREIFESAGAGQVQGAGLTVLELIDRTAHRIDHPVERLDPAAEAALRMMVGKTYRRLGKDGAAVPHLARVLELRRAMEGEVSVLVAEAYDALGRAYRGVNRDAEAEQMVEAAWRVYEQLLHPDDPYFAVTAHSLGLVKRKVRKYEESERWYLEALRRYRKAFGPESDHLPVTLSNLGLTYLSMRRLDEAEASLRESIALSKRLHQDELQLDELTAQGFLAEVLIAQGDPRSEAEELLVTAAEGLSGLLGTRHHRVRYTALEYADFLALRGRSSEAESLLADWYGADLAGGNFPEAFQSGACLAALWFRAGATEAAFELARDLLSCCAPHLPPDDLQTAAPRVRLAEVLLEAREREAACEQLQRADLTLRAALEQDSPDGRRAGELLDQLLSAQSGGRAEP